MEVLAVAEYGRTYAHMGRACRDGLLHIGTHAHGQSIHIQTSGLLAFE